MAIDVSVSSRPSAGRLLAFSAWVILVLGAVMIAAVLNASWHLKPGPDEFNVPRWELHNFANRWLWGAGELFRSGRSPERQDEDLRRFFAAVAEVERLERQTGEEGSSELSAAIAERDRYENRAEATLESRISDVAKHRGLTRDFGPLGDVLWPPVDMEFTTPPRSLATSPRDKIELKSTSLLEAGLDLEDVTRIEHERESRDGNTSALASPTAGVGAYPTIVTYTDSYREAVETAAHEWTHNYLAFRPLGVRYYENNDLRTMNETVADLVGQEVAAQVMQKWPLPPAQPAATSPAQGRPSIDLRAELLKLRGEVDALLAQGKVSEAEALMEERQQYLAANGYYIRRINQAFFAFNNLYAGAAGAPGAVNPIGPKIDELRRLSGSLGEFLRVAGGLTSVAELDRALAELRGGG